MKKYLAIIFTFALALLLVACKDDNGKGSNTGKVVLSYADWADPVFNRKMLDAFEEKYDHIEVQLRTDIMGSGQEFTGNLIDAAQGGLLPDVFVTDNVPAVVAPGLTRDVSSFWDNDEDADLVYEFMASTAIYNNKRFALPSFQFFKGIMINLDIFANANLTTVDGKYRIDDDGYPVKDWTFSEMIEIAKAIKNISSDPNETVAGLDTWYGRPDFQQVWPMMQEENVMYDTWDGEKFNYNTKNWIDALAASVSLHQLTDGTTTRFTEEQLEQYPHLAGYLIQTGIGAMDIEGSWQFWVIQDAKENDINLGFWPYPRAEAGGTLYPPVVLDYLSVSSQTEHPEEAYLLAKWMSYGRDGWNARINLIKEQNAELVAEGKPVSYLDRFPVADYPEVWSEVETLTDGIEGITEIFDNIENSKPDVDKWLPGYREFWSWVNEDAENPYNWDSLEAQGPSAAATFAVEWEKKINQIVKDAFEELGK